MTYTIEIKPKANRDLDSLSPEVAKRILVKIHAMKNDLAGDIKRLTNFHPGYRLRVGDYRVLFEAEEDRIIVYRILHRRKAYDR